MTTPMVLLLILLLAVATAGSLMVAPLWRGRPRPETGPADPAPSLGPVSPSVLISPPAIRPRSNEESRVASQRAAGGAPFKRSSSMTRRAGMQPWWDRARARFDMLWRDGRTAGWGPVASSVAGLFTGLATGGLVAGGALAIYAATGFVLLRGAARRRSLVRAQRLAADAVVGLAADLRAGAPVGSALRTAAHALSRAEAVVLPGRSGSSTPPEIARVGQLVEAATRLSQVSGAPLADVLDHLDVHLRAVERVRAVASAQAAGTHASAALLAAMPIAGLGLGMLMGVDPWQVLLRSAAGAGSLFVSILLQLGGIAWTVRLARVEVSP